MASRHEGSRHVIGIGATLEEVFRAADAEGVATNVAGERLAAFRLAGAGHATAAGGSGLTAGLPPDASGCRIRSED